MPTKTTKIPNINCAHCTKAIEREVGDLEGVTSVKAEIDSKMVTIDWNEPPATWSQITELLNEIGYPVS